jgi:hypothetical protein
MKMVEKICRDHHRPKLQSTALPFDFRRHPSRVQPDQPLREDQRTLHFNRTGIVRFQLAADQQDP